MQYKGDDLDLRVPHGRPSRESYAPEYEAPGNGRWSRSYAAGPTPSEPLWVDEVVLACCNYAFDVAQANGAAEVGLEHLVNALTRVDAAARTLELRGVREGQLRRESAALIASEVPAANAGDAVAPRRSGEFEDVLRRASELTSRRGSAASIDDVLWVLLHYGRDVPVVMLLRRLTPDWQRADWGRMREFATPDPAPRSMPIVVSDPVHSRMSGLEDSLRLMQSEFAAERKLLMDLVRDIQRDVVAQRGDGAAFRGDLGQRLESLERSMMSRSEVRLPVHFTDRIGALEKAVHGSLGETARSSRELLQRLSGLEAAVGEVRALPQVGALAEKIVTLETSVQSSLSDAARHSRELVQRLAGFETVLDAQSGSGAMAERMTALEKTVLGGLAEGARNWSHLGQKLNALEASLGGNGKATLGELVSRLEAIEERIQSIGGDGHSHRREVADRIGDVVRLIEARHGETSKLSGDVAERLISIENYLASEPDGRSGDAGAVIKELTERLGGLERAVRAGFGDAASTSGQMAERLVALERHLADRGRGDDGEGLLMLDERLVGLDRQLEVRAQHSTALVTQVLERVQALEQRPVGGGGGEAANQLMAASSEKIVSLQAGLGDIVNRLAALDERVKAEAVVTEEALRGRDQDFDFIYNEIRQLGQSQATLNSAVNDWRNESQEHFGTLATRLDKVLGTGAIEAVAASADTRQLTPIELPNVLQPPAGAEMRPVNGSSAQASVAPRTEKAAASLGADDYVLPEQPGHGFWYWLFGTSSVVRANRNSAIRVDRMRQNIREARERKRGGGL